MKDYSSLPFKNHKKEKQVSGDDEKGLLRFYYTIIVCLTTLQKFNYMSNLHSTNVL